MTNAYVNDRADSSKQNGNFTSGPSDHRSGPGPEVMSANTLEGNSVVNHQDENLGTIKEIMIDVPQGQVAYAVLESGGLLGMGSKLFAIPWGALTLDTERKSFVLNMDKETMKKAPGFDKDHWPSMANLNAYYGVKDYMRDRSNLGTPDKVDITPTSKMSVL